MSELNIFYLKNSFTSTGARYLSLLCDLFFVGLINFCIPFLLQLYNDMDMVPKTCANFKQLCIGDRKDVIKNDPTPWHLKYENTVFHRVVKNG